MAKRETISVPRRAAVSVLMNTVTVELICGDDYEAQVVYDDIVERLQKGEGLTLSVGQPPRPRDEAERD